VAVAATDNTAASYLPVQSLFHQHRPAVWSVHHPMLDSAHKYPININNLDSCNTIQYSLWTRKL